jgi:hypothetical protein
MLCFVNFCVQVLLPFFPVLSITTVSGNSRFLRTGFHTGAHRRHRVAKGGLHLWGEVNALDRRVKHFHKHVLSFEEPSASHLCNL